MNTVIIIFMEPLVSFTDHHPDVCYLQYETGRLSYITTEDTLYKFSVLQTTNRHWKFSMVNASNVAAVSDSNVIVDVSQPHIEQDGEYGQD